MLGPRHLKRIGTSYNSPAAQAITADVISGDSAIKRHRKQKYTNLKQLPYTEGKEETDEDFQATGDDGISNRVASHQHNRSAEEEDLEDSPAPGPRTRRGSAGAVRIHTCLVTRSFLLPQSRWGRSCYQHIVAGGKSQRNPLTMSPDTASTTSTPASNDSDVVPRSQHVGPSDTYPAADPSAAGTSQPATQLDGVSAAQESAPQLTQLEGVAISEAQLPSPIAHASRPELQDTLDAPQQHKPQTTKYTQGRPGSQNSPQLTRAQLIPAGENVQPGTSLILCFCVSVQWCALPDETQRRESPPQTCRDGKNERRKIAFTVFACVFCCPLHARQHGLQMQGCSPLPPTTLPLLMLVHRD